MRFGRIRSDVIAALAQTPAVQRRVRAVAEAVAADAARLAPRHTGRLRRSLAVENAYNPATGLREYHVGWDRSVAPYGGLVELGTEDTRARPHLRPAADKYKRR